MPAPLWVYLVAAVAPWLPLVALQLAWRTHRHYKWLAVFCLLIVSQAAYLTEHIARMAQLHILGRSVADAPGILGVLGLERVQFLWTTWAVLAILLVVQRFPRNPWLWVLLPISGLDAYLHMTMLAAHLSAAPTEPRAELLFVFSVAELAILGLAFAYQLARTYDAWLAHAFPHLPEHVWIETTGRLEELRLSPGERLEPDARRSYIVTRGTGMLVRPGPGGHEILLRMLSPGQVIHGGGILHAETALELLALPPGAASRSCPAGGRCRMWPFSRRPSRS